MRIYSIAELLLFLSAVASGTMLRDGSNEKINKTSDQTQPLDMQGYLFTDEPPEATTHSFDTVPPTPANTSTLVNPPSTNLASDIMSGPAESIMSSIFLTTIIGPLVGPLAAKKITRKWFNDLVESIKDKSCNKTEIKLRGYSLNDTDISVLVAAINSNPEFAKNITHIDLTNNLLTMFPDLSQCINLRDLNISENRLRFVTDLTVYKHLQSLNLTNNKFSTATKIALQKLIPNVPLQVIEFDSMNPPSSLNKALLLEHFSSDAKSYFNSEAVLQKIIVCNKLALVLMASKYYTVEDNMVTAKILLETLSGFHQEYKDRMESQLSFFKSAFTNDPEHEVLLNYIKTEHESFLARVNSHLNKIRGNIIKPDSVVSRAIARIEEDNKSSEKWTLFDYLKKKTQPNPENARSDNGVELVPLLKKDEDEDDIEQGRRPKI